MKRILTLALTVAAISLITVGCATRMSTKKIEASDKLMTKTLEVDDLNKLEVSSQIHVVYVQAHESSAEFVAPDNVMEYYRYKVSDGKLKVWKEGYGHDLMFKNNNNPKLIVKSPKLNGIDISGACTFTAKMIDLKNGDMDVQLSGASKLNLETLNCGKAKFDLSGASSAKVATVNVIDLSGECSGASNLGMIINGAETVSADCSGASTITLAGTARKVNLDCSGASKISAGELKAETGSVDASGASSIQSNIKTLTGKDSSFVSSIKNNVD